MGASRQIPPPSLERNLCPRTASGETNHWPRLMPKTAHWGPCIAVLRKRTDLFNELVCDSKIRRSQLRYRCVWWPDIVPFVGGARTREKVCQTTSPLRWRGGPPNSVAKFERVSSLNTVTCFISAQRSNKANRTVKPSTTHTSPEIETHELKIHGLRQIVDHKSVCQEGASCPKNGQWLPSECCEENTADARGHDYLQHSKLASCAIQEAASECDWGQSRNEEVKDC